MKQAFGVLEACLLLRWRHAASKRTLSLIDSRK
jgi:hypothetical protein